MKRIHLKSLVVGLILGASALAVGAFKNDIGAFKNDPRYIERLVRAGGNLQLLSTLLYEHEGSIEAAPGLSWPDGRQGTVLYLKTASGNWWRCVDYFTADMQYTDPGLCYWIENPKEANAK